jgi:hypothetical protein
MLETYQHLTVGGIRKILNCKLQHPLTVSVISVILVTITQVCIFTDVENFFENFS